MSASTASNVYEDVRYKQVICLYWCLFSSYLVNPFHEDCDRDLWKLETLCDVLHLSIGSGAYMLLTENSGRCAGLVCSLK